MSNKPASVVSSVTNTAAIKIEPLGQKANLAQVVEKVNEIISKVNAIKVRDRGPKSERAMTDSDAFEVKFGSLKDLSHKEAAAKLGLSYGQIYSARGGYTFTHIKKDFKVS